MDAENLQESLERKLNPNRFTAMSGKMAAIVGCILGVQYTDPQLVELCLTCDDYVLGRREGDCGANEWIGSGDDLRNNLNRLIEAAELTPEEISYLAQRVNATVRRA
jgi:hypothetical protein